MTYNPSFEDAQLERWRITVRGVVQGVGFRPFVYNAARAESLVGWVANDSDAVRIDVRGNAESLERFLLVLRHSHPPQARIDAIDVVKKNAVSDDETPASFEISASRGDAAPRPTIPADLATCAECLAEIRDPSQRRYGYAFTNCTNCGPRWSIIQQLPYDRSRTSMQCFDMCPTCRDEYQNPADRRFHAQPIACPDCGPSLRLLTCENRLLADGGAAVRGAAEAILSGRIVAVKGLGGFQLIVDATDEAAVARLRLRKQRPDRPFALMFSSAEEVRLRCLFSADERAILQSHTAPILLLQRSSRQQAADIAPSVAPGNPYLGVMLPYTPLHHLLCEQVGRPIVCTSGNLSDEPMVTSTDGALTRLGKIADLILTHNRPIVRPVDDSVGRVDSEGFQLARRARGYAPQPIRLAQRVPTIVAVGGHLKNTVALSLDTSVIVSPHIGDLDDLLSVDVHRRAVEDLIGFFNVTPEAVACDMHPDYASTRRAQQLADQWKIPLIPVQHHHAHVAACVAERGIEMPVLGLSWDGTGFGIDGTVWGGEILHCKGSAFDRLAHLRTFPLPGGDRVAREPRRAALGLLFEILGDAAAEVAGRWFAAAELRTLLAALRRPKLFPRTSSMGRLFDGVAAICGLFQCCSFEGQAAMALEFAADPEVRDAYPCPLRDGTPAVGDWEPLLRAVLADRQRGAPLAEIAGRFHNALADLALAAARRAACPRVVLTGGCFQNALLTERVRARLLEHSFDVYTHRDVPPGDGGISLGQLLIAAERIKEYTHVSGNPR